MTPDAVEAALLAGVRIDRFIAPTPSDSLLLERYIYRGPDSGRAVV